MIRRSAIFVALLAVTAALAVPTLARAQSGLSADSKVTVGSPATPYLPNGSNEPALAMDANHPAVLAAGANDLIDNAPCQGSSCDLTPDIGISGSISPSTAARRGRSRPAPVLRHKTAPPAWARSTPCLATSSTGCPKAGLQ